MSRKSVLKLTEINTVCFTLAGLVQYAAVFGGSRRLIDGYRDILPLDILSAFGTGAFSLAFHIYARHLHSCSVSTAKALVAANHRAYNAAWMVCVEDGAAADTLRLIEVFVTGRWGHLGPELLRHRAREADPLVQARAPPIESLEQLLGQAAVLVAFLRTKAKSWALMSEGRFPVLQCDDMGAASRGVDVMFERWEDIVKDGGMIRRVKWAKIKSTKRAVEKIYRCYDGEISRLVDCCRCYPSPVHSRSRDIVLSCSVKYVI